MPHVIIQYSANLDGKVNMHRLCRSVLKATQSTGVFEPGAVKVRALPADAYAIGDEDERNAFIAIEARFGAGRDPATKKKIGDAVFQAVTAEVGDLANSPYVQLTLHLTEIDREHSWGSAPKK